MVWKPNIIGMLNIFRRPVTLQYPFEKLEVGGRYRGIPAVNPEICTSCSRCVEVCPNKCTVFSDYKGRQIPNWYGARCMFCALCIEVCPTGARVSTPLYELASYTREATLFEPGELEKVVQGYGKLSEKPYNTLDAPVAKEEVCIACLECKRICPVTAISNVDRETKRTITIDYNTCIFCGKCIAICPVNALYYKEREKKENEKFSWNKGIPRRPDDVDTYYHLLDKEVIAPRFCSHCTACITVCPVERIEGADTYVHEIVEIPCTNCSLCYRVCPRVKYANPKMMGEYIEAASAKSKRFKGQDGAIGTESLVAAFELGIVDAAVVVTRTEDWKPMIRIARNPKELLEGLRTKYATSDMLTGLKIANQVSKKGIALVGIPCQIEGYDSMKNIAPHLTEKVKFVLGLFCFENFYWHRLHKEFFEEKNNIDLKGLQKEDIRKGKLTIMVMDIITKEGKKFKWEVKDLEEYALEGCSMCQHFTNLTADVVVGGAGSERGFNTVMVRSETGKRIFEHLKKNGYIEEAPEEKRAEALKGAQFLAELKIKQHPLDTYLSFRQQKKGEGGS